MSRFPTLMRTLLALLLTANLAHAQGLPGTVEQALKRAAISPSGVSAFVQALDSARPAVDYNATAPMNPASTMKLVTTYAALELLGPTYTWKTEAYISGSMQGDVLEGDLILKGYGDPKLTLENFWLLLHKLRALGLREIRGNLVLDRNYFEAAEDDPATFDGDPLRAYNVGPDALLVNFKAVRFLFVPDSERKSVTVIAEPKPAGLEFSASVRATEAPCGDWRSGLKADLHSNGSSARATFTGSMPASCGELVWNAGLLTHSNYVYGVFRSLWEELGGALRGGLKDGGVPANARLLVTHASASNAELVRDINKFSNNVMARQLFLTLGAEMLKLPGRTDRSSRVVQSWLAEKKLDFPELVMENGSGLSRQERISAGHMGRLLIEAYHSAVMPEFMSSLPLVAYDGTMRRRLRFESLAGQAHIKTGSLADARTMAGYVLDKNGHRHVVVLFINHANAGAGQAAQDALLRWAYEGASPRP
jgi:D-alanyl-D-alanine carboxypeptidase/D-alanyl-D-alanine-endopeptidase (penicillin-binding protein 4)